MNKNKSMSSTRKSSFNSEYFQSCYIHSYDSSQSPLALLAQTCSSIGKDSSTPPLITSPISSNVSNLDKSFSSSKNSSLNQLNNQHTNKKSTLSLKTKPVSTSSSFIESNHLSNYFPPLFDPQISLTALFLRSYLAYLSSQQQNSYSTICTIPGCLQCQIIRQILSTSINNQPYICHWKTCNATFCSNDQLIEHIRCTHRLSKPSNYHRFHPYLKASNMVNSNNHLPYFDPHLSLSLMTETTKHLNKNSNNK